MKKIRFVIVGSGWRSLYYVRIARALPEQFACCAMLCRTKEKAAAIHASQGIFTTVSVTECMQLRPDFVVVAVDKPSISRVSMEWISYGFAVLCETPAALEADALCELWRLHRQQRAKLLVAEQYTRFPVYQAMRKILDEDLIGAPDCAVVSLAHEYHGASLIRALLRTGLTPFRVEGKEHIFLTTETLTRYERVTDGRVTDKKRTTAVFEFENGETAFYDFDSEQYRSPIRKNYVDVRGCRGEMKDNRLYYLDGQNRPQETEIQIGWRLVETSEKNPNLNRFTEITEITCDGRCLYAPPFGLCGLSEDETALALVMADMAAYERGEKEPEYSLREALQDAYMAILLRESVKTGKAVMSERMPWHEGG
ncbi:MAG: Gfo/Idh/MocA family oxidoreductase [Clostridiales bacterium]|nr:Gfo/Idh/MocA family oxidoreductase [Clostridiales bacterium]